MTSNIAKMPEEGQQNVVQATSLLDVISRAASDQTVDVDKMDRLLAMHERLSEKSAEQAFNQAMKAAQSKMTSVGADLYNSQTRSKYASYAALDRALRPVYTEEGFSLSFDTGDGAPEGFIRVLAYVAHDGGFTRTYRADMPADGKGAKGGDVMTKTHAAGAAMSYGSRYLLKMIFNVAVGEDDKDGNMPSGFINANQIKTIERLLDETDTDFEVFLNGMFNGAVKQLQEIPAHEFPRCMEMLNKKKRLANANS